MNNKKCTNCEQGWVKKNGVYSPCKHCITPDRFEKTLKTAIQNCGNDYERKKALLVIEKNLPEYSVVAYLEAESYGKFNKEFVSMLRDAYDVKPFMDVKYKPLSE
tara:strand:- start:120 stop:434 length:315 start_codon:yes stop_codon:yes gene_type:complete